MTFGGREEGFLDVRELKDDLAAVRDFASQAEELGFTHLRIPEQIARKDSGPLHEPLTLLAEKAHDSGAGAAADQVVAYMPGRVVALLVSEGDRVEAGQGVLVLEAMKMENEIQAEHGGVVEKFFVASGQAVEGGDPLYEIS